MPTFSIVIPTYNAVATLSQTLESLQCQSFRDWEAIIVDDGSKDATVFDAGRAAARDSRFRVVHNPGKGPSEARNFGAMVHARGEYVAFCDADDIWMPHKLEQLALAFAARRSDALFGQIGFFRSDPAQVTSTSSVPRGLVTVPMLLGENPVCTMSNVTVRRDVFLRLGGFATDMVHNEDLDWLIRLVGEGYHLRGLNEMQVLYRTSMGGLSSDLAAMRAGRDRALATARGYGFSTNPAAEAVHLRYLARRALRLNVPAREAWGLARQGLSTDARAFLTPPRRGVPTALGAFLGRALPSSLRRTLFSR